MNKSVKDIFDNSPVAAMLRACLTEQAPSPRRRNVGIRPKARLGEVEPIDDDDKFFDSEAFQKELRNSLDSIISKLHQKDKPLPKKKVNRTAAKRKIEQKPKRKIEQKPKSGRMLVDMSKVGLGAERDPRYYIDNTMNPLDEVVVTGKLKPKQFYNPVYQQLVESADNTRVMNVPHREYNQHLKGNTIRGAKAHAAWEKDNPASAKAGRLLGSLPFIVMGGRAALPVLKAAAPYMSGSYLLGNIGRYIAGNVGSQVGGAIGNAADLGLSGMGVYNGVKTLTDSNSDAFDKTVGIGNALLNSFPLFQTSRMALRSSIADDVYPVGYVNALPSYNKGEQVKKSFKDALNKVLTLRANRPVSEQPYWFDAVGPGRYNSKFSRQDALNLAMKQPVYNNTYIKNSDGTYSYNPEVPYIKEILDNPEKVISMNIINDLKNLKDGEKYIMGDFITSNGGNVEIIRNGDEFIMSDKWDLQPFKAKFHPFGKFGNFMSKYFPNFEVVKAVGGDPFWLKQSFKLK